MAESKSSGLFEGVVNTFNNLKLKHQLLGLVTLVSLGMVSALYVNNQQHNNLMVNGPVYDQVILQKDLIADILPPPEYLLESWQVALEMAAFNNQPIQPLIEKGNQLKKDFETRHAYWEKHLNSPSIRDAMIKDLYQTGERFLAVRDQIFIPAIKSGDVKRIDAALSTLQEAYTNHRKAVDKVVELANAESARIESSVPKLILASEAKTYVFAGFFILFATLVCWLIVSNIIRMLGGEAKEALEAAQKIANGVFQHSTDVGKGKQMSVIKALNLATDTLLEIDQEMARMEKEHAEGNMNATIDVSRFKGAYRDMAQDINHMVALHVDILKKTSDSLERLGRGDFDAELENLPGDLAVLNMSFDGLKTNVCTLISDMGQMTVEHSKGEVDVLLNVDKFDGDFKTVASEVNAMVSCHVQEKDKLVHVMDSLGRGDLTVELEPMPGKKAAMNKSVERIRGNLKGIVDSVNWVSAEHDKGNIDMTLRADMFKGQFSILAESVNKLVAGHVELNQKAMACVKAFGEGDFNAPLEKFPGKKAFINETVEQVRSNLIALNEDSQLLANAARQGEVLVRADVSRHHGDYRKIVQGMNDTLDMIVQPIVNVKTATDAINTAAKEIAQGNADLSRRTEEQASSLEKTASNMDVLANTVKQNAENAKQANQLANEASDVALKGGKAVNEVVNTMSAMNESARKIEDIITVIDSIAFQTNILALNAAVEAARAGEQGRGFAVVAGEVGNLAQRSSSAAKEIKELINDSVQKTAEGSKQVSAAGETMQDIVNSVKRVSDIISEITTASIEQSNGIATVNEAIITMDDVTQQNTALVEQAAAAAESLMDQANELANTVSVFNVDDAQQEYMESDYRMVSNAY